MMCVIFEGRDAAGKGGVIKRITDPLNPRVCRVVALATPTERERGQVVFPAICSGIALGGEIVLFDRSWYNRAGVERVMGFCTEDEYQEFLRSCPLFEEMLVRSGIMLVKYWFSVNDEEQRNGSKTACAIRSNVGSLARWTQNPAGIGSIIHRQRTLCSPEPTLR